MPSKESAYREILEVVDLAEDLTESHGFCLEIRLKAIDQEDRDENVERALELYQELKDAATAYDQLARDLLRTIGEYRGATTESFRKDHATESI